MKQTIRDLILTGNIPSLLIKLTLPSIIGMLSIMIFNVVDTYFVGKLGSVELAAVSFTFPVVMVLNSITLGVGTAAMALFSKAVGTHNVEEERLLATSSLLLGLLLAVIFSVTGIFTIEPLFHLIGADDKLLPLIKEYMGIWYIGTVFIVVPMIGDGILRGLGDTKTPSFVMLASAVVNAVLDPLLIFGIGPFPEMGIGGAALATVFARMIAAVISLCIQLFREKLLTFKVLTVRSLFKEWKAVMYLAVPNAAIKAIVPLGTAVFNALAVTAAVFIGQNLGTGNLKRMKDGISWLYLYCLIFGVFAAILLIFAGGGLGGFFSQNDFIINIVKYYLYIVPLSYVLFGIGQVGTSILNVYNKPMLAGGLSVLQIGAVGIPFAYQLSARFAEIGLFSAIALSYLVFGLFSIITVRHYTRKLTFE